MTHALLWLIIALLTKDTGPRWFHYVAMFFSGAYSAFCLADMVGRWLA